MVRIIIKAVLSLFLLEIFLVTPSTGEEICQSKRQIEEQCGPHTYKTVKPMLDYFRQVRNELEQSETKEKQLNQLNSNLMEKYHEILRIHEKVMKEALLLDEYKSQIVQKDNELDLYKILVSQLKSEIDTQKTTIDKCNDELLDKSKNVGICEFQMKQLNSSLIEREENISRNNAKWQKDLEDKKAMELKLEQSQAELINKEKDKQLCQKEVDKLNRTTQNIFPSSCIPFGEYPGVHQIKVSGVGFFAVLCNSQLAGPGWIVVEQRVSNKENFNRDWASYREGFGSFDSDFFLGLEKLHHLTKLRRYELYVNVLESGGKTYYARYDDFKISDEENEYAVSVGNFEGHLWDNINYSEPIQFSTIDRDNCESNTRHCAEYRETGWWYRKCHGWNVMALYGIPFSSFPIQKSMMLMRPKE